LTLYPGECVAECDQLLIQGAIGIPAAVAQCDESGPERDGGVAVGIDSLRRDHVAIGRNVGIIEADIEERLPKCLIAAPKGGLKVEATAYFIDDRGREEMCF